MAKVAIYIVLFFFCVGMSWIVKRANEKKISNYKYVLHHCSSCDKKTADSLLREIDNGNYDLKDTYLALRDECMACEKELSTEMVGNTPDTVWWKKRVVFKRKIW